MRLTFFQDARHGYLRVPVKLIKELKLEDEISSYSFMTPTYIYLEEDCDAPKFLAKCPEAELTYKYNHTATCRKYSPYNKHYLGGLEYGQVVLWWNHTKFKVVEVERRSYVVQDLDTKIKYRLQKTNFAVNLTDYVEINGKLYPDQWKRWAIKVGADPKSVPTRQDTTES